MTLIELLVVLSILSIVGTVIMVAFSVGLVAFGRGGVTDRTTAADDLIVFEQRLGEDVARAVCIEAPTTSSMAYGSCTNSLSNAATPCVSVGLTKSLLCIAWPQPQPADSTTWVCHTAVYSPAGSVIMRKETWGVSSGQTHISLDPVNVGSVTLVTPSHPLLGVSWIAQVWVSNVMSATPILRNRNPPIGNFQLQPLTVNPAAATVRAAC
jgi:hypothetical protein